MPSLAPIAEDASSGSATSNRRRREHTTSSRGEHNTRTDKDIAADDILALLESTTPSDDNDNLSDSHLQTHKAPRASSSSNTSVSKQSAMRDQKYGSRESSSVRASRQANGISYDITSRRPNRQQEDDGISTKKVRFAASGKAGKPTGGGEPSGDNLPHSTFPSAGRSTVASLSAKDDNRMRSTPSVSSSNDASHRSISGGTHRYGESRGARDIVTPIAASFSDGTSSNGRQLQREMGNSAALESKRRHEEQIQTLQRRHEEEIKAIAAEHESQLDRAKEKEVDAATLSRLVGPVSESAQLLQALKDELVESKALAEQQSSKLATEAEKELAITRETRKQEATLLKEAVNTLHMVSKDLKSQSLKEREQLDAERSRLELLQSSLQKEREELLRLQQEERNKLMARLEAFELERRRHTEEAKRQQIDLQRARDDIKKEKSDLSMRIQDYEYKLEKKRESIAREKELLIDAKDELMRERVDFEERRRMAKLELQGAETSRKELAEMKRKVDTEVATLESSREQLQHQTRAFLERETAVDAKLVQAQKIEASNEQMANNLRAAKDEHDKILTKLEEREERLLHSSLDAMKSRYYLQKGETGTGITGIDPGTSKYMYPPLSAAISGSHGGGTFTTTRT